MKTIRVMNRSLLSLLRRERISSRIILMISRVILFKIRSHLFLTIKSSSYARATINFVIWFKAYRLERRKRFISFKKFRVNFFTDLINIQKMYISFFQRQGSHIAKSAVSFLLRAYHVSRSEREDSWRMHRTHDRSAAAHRFDLWNKKRESSQTTCKYSQRTCCLYFVSVIVNTQKLFTIWTY